MGKNTLIMTYYLWITKSKHFSRTFHELLFISSFYKLLKRKMKQQRFKMADINFILNQLNICFHLEHRLWLNGAIRKIRQKATNIFKVLFVLIRYSVWIKQKTFLLAVKVFKICDFASLKSNNTLPNAKLYKHLKYLTALDMKN